MKSTSIQMSFEISNNNYKDYEKLLQEFLDNIRTFVVGNVHILEEEKTK